MEGLCRVSSTWVDGDFVGTDFEFCIMAARDWTQARPAPDRVIGPAPAQTQSMTNRLLAFAPSVQKESLCKIVRVRPKKKKKFTC
jgi:hypothetical protein